MSDSNTYTLVVSGRTPRPRSKRLRELGTSASGGSGGSVEQIGGEIKAAVELLLSMFELDTQSQPGKALIKAKLDGLYTNGTLSALGVSDAQAAAQALYALLDVYGDTVNARVKRQDGTAAQAGDALTLATVGGVSKWVAGAAGGSGTVTGAVMNGTDITPDASGRLQLGTVLTAITKAMVEGVLTGNINSHSHSYLPLAGGTMTGDISLNNSSRVIGSSSANLSTLHCRQIDGDQDGANLWIRKTSTTGDVKIATNSTERMAVTAGGNVGIGTSSPTEKLEVNGTAKVGNLTSTGYVTALSAASASDARMKDVAGDVELSLDDIADAPSVRFTWRGKDLPEQVGTLAQHWQDVLPQVVGEVDGHLAMNYDAASMVSVITLARELREAKREMREMRGDIEQLKATVNELLGR